MCCLCKLVSWVVLVTKIHLNSRRLLLVSAGIVLQFHVWFDGFFVDVGSCLPFPRSLQYFRHVGLLRPFCLYYRRCYWNRKLQPFNFNLITTINYWLTNRVSKPIQLRSYFQLSASPTLWVVLYPDGCQISPPSIPSWWPTFAFSSVASPSFACPSVSITPLSA